jgi:hypothetical protein
MHEELSLPEAMDAASSLLWKCISARTSTRITYVLDTSKQQKVF